jgi:hypothetical protein
MARIRKYSNPEAEEGRYTYEIRVVYRGDKPNLQEDIITNHLKATTSSINGKYTFDFENDDTTKYAYKRYETLLKGRNVKEIMLSEKWKQFGTSRMTLLHVKNLKFGEK